MKVDSKAPLSAKKEITIKAPVSRVWQIQTDINKWPQWQKDVSTARLQGELLKGSTFTWTAMGMPIVSVLQDVEVEKTIGWTGRSIGMQAIHLWRFEKKGESTQVITEESLSGWFPRLLKLFKPDFLEMSLSKALQTLKNQAELHD